MRLRALLMICGGLLLLPGNLLAYNILDISMGGYWNNLADQNYGAIPGYGTPGGTDGRYFTMVNYQDLAATNLLNYDVVVVSSSFTDDFVYQNAGPGLAALQAKQPDILSFVQAGHGLVAWTEPFPDGSTWNWPWAPVSLQSQGVFDENLVEVADPNAPVMLNSSDQSLSDWHAAWHGYFDSWDPRLEVVARTGDYGPGDPRTHRALELSGAYNPDGTGRMLFGMQDPDYHAYQGVEGAKVLARDALDETALGHLLVPEPSTFLLLAAGLAALPLIGLLRRRALRHE